MVILNIENSVICVIIKAVYMYVVNKITWETTMCTMNLVGQYEITG